MYVSLRQKAILSTVGLVFSIGILLLFPWWLVLLAFAVMGPFFLKILTA